MGPTITSTGVTDSDTFTLIVACPILAVILAGCVVGGIAFMRNEKRGDGYGLNFARACTATAASLLVALLVLTWWGLYPYKAEYHEYTDVTGRVDTIDSRLLASGEGGTNQKFVVVFEGSDTQYGVNDTRAASARTGDTLSIQCVRVYQWAGTHGYDCAFNHVERAK